MFCLVRSDIKRRPLECSFRDDTKDLLTDKQVDFDSSRVVYYKTTRSVKVKNITLSKQCSKTKEDSVGLYLPSIQRGASKGHGIIRINLHPVCYQHVDGYTHLVIKIHVHVRFGVLEWIYLYMYVCMYIQYNVHVCTVCMYRVHVHVYVYTYKHVHVRVYRTRKHVVDQAYCR